AFAASGQLRGICLSHRPAAALGPGQSGHAGSPAGAAGRSGCSPPTLLRSPPVDQLALAFTPPGIGHNQPPEGIDPIEALNMRLTANHADLLTRFCDLELACGRVPDPIASEEDAATATDFIAQCQQIGRASCRE